jgi:hypothetical protein
MSRYRFGKIVNIRKSNLTLRCDIPFKTKFLVVYKNKVVIDNFKVDDYVEIKYHYDDEHLIILDSIKKVEIEICPRCFSFLGQNVCECKSIRDIDTKLRLHESMRLIHRQLCSGYELGFVDESGYYLRSERIYRINPLFDIIDNLVLNKAYEVIAWQKYKKSWYIEVLDIVDRDYIF